MTDISTSSAAGERNPVAEAGPRTAADAVTPELVARLVKGITTGAEPAVAQRLHVHPNTVRYRLRRVSELTGLVPGDGRDGFALWIAVAFGRLAHKDT